MKKMRAALEKLMADDAAKAAAEAKEVLASF